MEASFEQSRVLLRFIAMKCFTQKLSRDQQMPIMFRAILRVVSKDFSSLECRCCYTSCKLTESRHEWHAH
eukprot:12390-Heterococcus_DN1.PRE.1